MSWATAIMAAAMNAQNNLTGLPQHGVELGGSFDAPVVTNHKDKPIVAYVLVITTEAGRDVDISMANPNTQPLLRGLPIAPGASSPRQFGPRHVHQDGSPVTVLNIALDSV